MSRQLDKIASFLSSGPHPIEPRFAQNLLTRFLAEMDAAQGGEDLITTLLKEKRHENRPRLLYQEADGSWQTAEFSTLDSRAGQIALLQLSGAMMQDDFLSTKGMRSFADDIRRADQNPNISGIIIEANTGGGELLAGQTLRNAIKDAAKPVLVYAHYLASAGVWGTLFAGHIMAAGKGSEIGSIGVYTALNREFLAAYKDRVLSVYSRKSPNKNAEFRALLAGDTKPLEDSITEADEIFMADVRRNRPLAGEVEDTLSGGMFFAADAKERGLVDSIGTFQDAIAQIGRMIRNQKSNTMKVSFVALAKKLLGVEATSEEQAIEALESAEVKTEEVATTEEQPVQGPDLNAAIEALSASVAALQGEVTALKEQAETLRNDLTQAAATIPGNTASQEDVNTLLGEIQTFRNEVASQINELRVQRSGAQEAGDESPELHEGKKVEGPKINLLENIGKSKVRVIPGLQ